MGFAYNNLRLFRQKNGYTQEQIAEKLGVSRQAVAKWESGASVPNIDNMIALADLYDMSVDTLARNLTTTVPPQLDEGKHLFGFTKMNENGEVALPEKAREVFGLKPGDSLLLLGDEDKGLALVKSPEINHNDLPPRK